MIGRVWSEQVKITFWAWLATLGAAAMLSPLVTSKRYLVVGAIGAAGIAATGAFLRARRTHLLLVLGAELVVAFEWCILFFANDHAVLGIVPGPDAVADLRERWSSYADMAYQFAAPLPAHADVTMAMSMILVGLAVIIDVVAVSWRRVSILGMLFLAVYMTPVSILGGKISAFAFLTGALGFVFLLAADERERLTHWGRQISTASSLWDRPSEVDEVGLRRNGARVGLGAIAMAVVLPIVVPTLSPHYFGQTGTGGGPGSGSTDTAHLNDPVLDMQRNLLDQTDEVLLRVTTNDPDPNYLRMAALPWFTGSSWEAEPREEENAVSTQETLPPSPGRDPDVATNVYNYDVTVTDKLGTRWLPLVYAPTSISIDDGSWLVDRVNLDAYADEVPNSSELSYSFTGSIARPTRLQMRQADRPNPEVEVFRELPDEIPPELRRRTREITSQAPSRFAKAQALEDWFRIDGGFEYSLDDQVRGNGIDEIMDFLFESKSGYCEQYASAMAIMARILNIPARVAIGFLSPERVDGNTWQFRGTDMHAWPELYFGGIGWVRFEPTPNTTWSEDSRPVSFPDPGDSTSTAPTAPPTNELPTQTPRDTGADPSQAAAPPETTDSGGSSPLGIIALSVGGLAVLCGLPRLLRAGVRRRRWSRAVQPVAVAEAAWAELRDSVLDLRIDWDAGATPRAIGRSLRERLPDDGSTGGGIVTSLNRLVLAVEQGRYARSIRDPEGLRSAVRVVSDALTSRQTSGTRFLARWLPASLVRRRSGRRRTAHRGVGELLVSVED